MNILAWVVLGLIAAIIARALAPGLQRLGLALSTLLGIAGSLAGGFIALLLANGRVAGGLHSAGLLGSLVGAILLLGLASVVAGRRRLTF